MRSHVSSSLLLALALGCGAAPTPAPEGVAITMRPRVGARYDVVVVVDATIPALDGRLRSVSRGTLEVVAADETGAVLRSTESVSRLEVPDNEITLPPVVRESGCMLELRVGPHGDLLGAPEAVGTACDALQHAPPGIVALLPEGSVRVGDSWPIRSHDVGTAAPDAPVASDGTVTLAALDGAGATISWEGSADSGPIARYGGTLRLRSVHHAETTIALADGLARRGSARIDVTPETTGDATSDFAPERFETTWCIAGEGEPPCEMPEPATSERPAATAYVGDACEPRVARFEAALAAYDPPPMFLHRGEVEAIDHGTLPIGATPAPVVRVDANGIRFDGRSVDVAQMLEDLAATERNWRILHASVPFPGRVLLQLAPGTPLASVEPVLAALVPISNVDVVVAHGERPASPPLPSWAGPPPASEDDIPDYRSHLWSVAVRGCPLAITALMNSGAIDIDARRELLRTGLAEAFRECGCGGVDIDAIESLAQQAGVEMPVASLVIPRGATGAALTLRRSGTTADLVRALADRATPGAPVRLRWRP